jgi:MiaB/RimO family radical SAM methylthiotransferase
VQDLRKAIRKLRRQAPEAFLLVTGCAAQVFTQDLQSLAEVNAVVPQKAKPELKNWPAPGTPSECLSYPDLQISGYSRSRAVLKVQDGCSHKCTYCIVPQTRGPAVSRDPQQALQEAERLFQAGIREIVLSGINLHQFGRDLEPNMDFWDLLSLLDRQLAPKWAGQARIRLSSLEPSDLTDKALQTISQCRMLCPHLHISLQSASSLVLKKMGRAHYGPEQVEIFLKKLHTFWPTYALGADILLGFPGEDHQEFLKTMNFCQKMPFSYAHVFSYSPRPGTAAAKMKEQVAPEETKKRSRLLRELLAEKRRSFYQKLLLMPKLCIILENSDPLQGISEYYVSGYLQQSSLGKSVGEILKAKPRQTLKEGLLVSEIK